MIQKTLILVLFVSMGLNVQAKRRKSKTIGDLLTKIEKQENTNSGVKSFTSLPKSSRPVRNAPKNFNSIKPPRINEIMRGADKDTTALSNALDASIDQALKLSKRFRKSPNRGELWLRLGELYVEKSKLLESQIYAEFDKSAEKFNSKKLKRKPKLNLRPAQAYNNRAIKLYEWFIRDFPKDPKIDQALFFLGYNYFQVGKVKKGAHYYKVLAKRFPRSDYVEEANFSLGEYYFENNSWKEALTYYNRVVRIKNSRLLSFALYKKAWCLFRLRKFSEGLKNLEYVIQASKRGDSESKGRRLRLRAEAIRAVVPFYAQVGSYKNARSYMRKTGGDKLYKQMLERLAYSYIDIGKRTSGKHIFDQLIEDDPTNVKAPDWQYQVVSAYSTGGDQDVYLRELSKWIANYSPSSDWHEENRNNSEAINNAETIREKFLRNHTLQKHLVVQNTRNRSAQKIAMAGYKLFIQYFPNSKFLPEMRFFYGELLYDMKKYDAASEQYFWVVKNGQDSKYFGKAINNSLLAVEKGVPSLKQIKKIVGDRTDPVPLTDGAQKFVDLGSEYIKKYPKNKKNLEIKFRIGRIYYSFNHFDKAEPIFREIVRDEPKSKYATYSANLVLDIYNIKKDYKMLSQVGTEFLAVPGLKNSKIEGEIRTIVDNANFLQAKNLEDKKDYQGSAESYQSFAKANPKSSLAVAANYNAAINYERVGEVLLAISLYGKVLSSNSKKYSDQRKKAKILRADLLKRVGRYSEAAREYESYASLYRTEKIVPDLHYNAALIWDSLNVNKKAITNYDKYYELSKSSSKTEALFRIAKIYEKTGSHKTAQSYFQKFSQQRNTDINMLAESYFKIGESYEKSRQKSKAFQWYQKTYQSFKGRSGIALEYAAHAKYKLIEDQLMAYERINLSRNQSASVVNKKLSALESLTKEFTSLIEMNSASFVVSALTGLGEANENFVIQVEGAPVPKGLSKDELQQYKAGIEQLVKPKRDATIDLYKQALDKANELEAYNDDVAKAREGLARLLPAQYRPWKDYMIPEGRLDLGGFK